MPFTICSWILKGERWKTLFPKLLIVGLWRFTKKHPLITPRISLSSFEAKKTKDSFIGISNTLSDANRTTQCIQISLSSSCLSYIHVCNLGKVFPLIRRWRLHMDVWLDVKKVFWLDNHSKIWISLNNSSW